MAGLFKVGTSSAEEEADYARQQSRERAQGSASPHTGMLAKTAWPDGPHPGRSHSARGVESCPHALHLPLFWRQCK